MANTFKNNIKTGIGTSGAGTSHANPVYVAGSGVTATIIGMTCANVTSSDVTVDVKLTDNSASQASSFIVKDAPVPAGGSLVVVGGNQKIVLEEADSITVISSAASSIDATLSIMEQD